MPKIALGVAIIALVLGGVATLGPSQMLGGQFYEQNHKTFLKGLTTSADTFVKGLTEGGGVGVIDPVDATLTLTEAHLLTYNVITFPASSTQPALTVTLPATSTMSSLLPNAGDTRNWVVINPFTAAATTTTIAAGSGIDLQEPDGQNVVIGINNFAWLTCFRKPNTDVVCRVDETIPAD